MMSDIALKNSCDCNDILHKPAHILALEARQKLLRDMESLEPKQPYINSMLYDQKFEKAINHKQNKWKSKKEVLVKEVPTRLVNEMIAQNQRVPELKDRLAIYN